MRTDLPPHDAMARAIADCLEQHLEEYGVQLYRYPSGEMKGIELNVNVGHADIGVILHGVGGGLFKLIVLTERAPT